jgi:hypothetical protein
MMATVISMLAPSGGQCRHEGLKHDAIQRESCVISTI